LNECVGGITLARVAGHRHGRPAGSVGQSGLTILLLIGEATGAQVQATVTHAAVLGALTRQTKASKLHAVLIALKTAGDQSTLHHLDQLTLTKLHEGQRGLVGVHQHRVQADLLRTAAPGTGRTLHEVGCAYA
jgi:hypothetical protein